MGKLEETLTTLREAAAKHDSVCVAYSGGKDSMTVMDLCCRTFKRVEAAYMYFVPGLPSEEAKLAYCKERFGVTPFQIPHWASLRALRAWAYVDPQPAIDFLPEWTLQDSYAMMREHTGCGYVATGAKRSDSSWRRRFLTGTTGWLTVINPIEYWNKFDVLGYMQQHDLPIPEAVAGKNASGVGLGSMALCDLYDKHPSDFDVLCEYFNLARVEIAYREFYGGS